MDLIKHALFKPFMVWKLNFNYSRKRMKNKCKMLLFDIVLAPKDKQDEITKSGPFAPKTFLVECGEMMRSWICKCFGIWNCVETRAVVNVCDVDGSVGLIYSYELGLLASSLRFRVQQLRVTRIHNDRFKWRTGRAKLIPKC